MAAKAKPPARPATPPPKAPPPRIVEAVAASGAAGASAKAGVVEAAAVEAIKKAQAEGVTDVEEIRRRIREASRKAMRS